MRIVILSTFLAAVGVVGLSSSWAQEEPPVPKPDSPRPADTPRDPPPTDEPSELPGTNTLGEPERDPFDSTPTIDAAIGDDTQRAEFVADADPDWAPVIRLRGYAEDAKGQTIATLEVDGETTHIVRTGDTVTHYAGRRSIALRVVRIEDLQVLVEVGRLRQAIVVR